MTTTTTTMDTFRYYNPLSPPSSTTTTSAADSPNVLDALCATHDHRLDALPDLLDVFAGKGVVNKELTGQLHNQGQEAPVCLYSLTPSSSSAVSCMLMYVMS
jgi:hypothetical protein